MESFEQAMAGAPEVIITEDTHVSCDGGGGALGHPKRFTIWVTTNLLCVDIVIASSS